MVNGETIGKILKDLRIGENLSQVKVESITKIKREYLSKLEGGGLRNPTIVTLNKLCDAYGVELSIKKKEITPEKVQEHWNKRNAELEKKYSNMAKEMEALTLQIVTLRANMRTAIVSVSRAARDEMANM